MSKSFENQIKIMQESCGLSREDAIEKLTVFNAIEEDEDGNKNIVSDFIKVIEYYRNKKNYNKLEEIIVIDRKFEYKLRYCLYSKKENSRVMFDILIKDKNYSISKFFENANILENEIDENFDIMFY
ncbi:MAG: NADH-quinone oxidoreductase subunit C [Candidatus Gastranaerophilales bacterium]|nr:NADH-quinone oxidoreductase subunit C [Candidatus Gastranaerophilales bacterium]